MRDGDLIAAFLVGFLVVGLIILYGVGVMLALSVLFGTPVGWWPFVASLVLLLLFGSTSIRRR